MAGATKTQTRKARAFVLEPFDLPLKNAREYGDVTYVYDKDAERPSIWSPDFVPDVMRTLDRMGYDPDLDYFVVYGHQVPLVMTLCALAAHGGTVNLLLWSATERRYVARTVTAMA